MTLLFLLSFFHLFFFLLLWLSKKKEWKEKAFVHLSWYEKRLIACKIKMKTGRYVSQKRETRM